MMLLFFMPITWIIGMAILFLDVVTSTAVKNERFLVLKDNTAFQVVYALIIIILFAIPLFY